MTIHFSEADRQMLNHVVDVVGDRMHHEDGYSDQDRSTLAKLDELAKAGPAIVADGAPLVPRDEATLAFQDIVKAELAHWVPDASTRLLYRAGRMLGVHQPDPSRATPNCGPNMGDHATVSDWVAGMYLSRCVNCFRLYGV